MKSLWPAVDSWLSVFIEKNISHFFEVVATWISKIANVEYVLVVSILLIVYFIFRKKWQNVVTITLATGMTTVIVSLMKSYFMVLRPQNGLYTTVHNDSFPSGHASMAAAFFVSLLIIYLPTIKSKFRRNLFVFLCLTCILLVGISRLLINVHWLSDVVFGWIIGSLLALLAGWISLKFDIKKRLNK